MKNLKNSLTLLLTAIVLCLSISLVPAQNTNTSKGRWGPPVTKTKTKLVLQDSAATNGCCNPGEIRSDHEGGIKIPNTNSGLVKKKNIDMLPAKVFTPASPATLYTKELILKLFHEYGTVQNNSSGGQLSVNNLKWQFYFNGVWSPGPHKLILKRVSNLAPSYQRNAIFANGTPLYTGVMSSNPSGIPFYSMQHIINQGHVKNGHVFAARVVDGNGYESPIVQWVYTGQSLPVIDVTTITQPGHIVNKLNGVDLSKFKKLPNIDPDLPQEIRKTPNVVIIKKPQ